MCRAAVRRALCVVPSMFETVAPECLTEEKRRFLRTSDRSTQTKPARSGLVADARRQPRLPAPAGPRSRRDMHTECGDMHITDMAPNTGAALAPERTRSVRALALRARQRATPLPHARRRHARSAAADPRARHVLRPPSKKPPTTTPSSSVTMEPRTARIRWVVGLWVPATHTRGVRDGWPTGPAGAEVCERMPLEQSKNALKRLAGGARTRIVHGEVGGNCMLRAGCKKRTGRSGGSIRSW